MGLTAQQLERLVMLIAISFLEEFFRLTKVELEFLFLGITVKQEVTFQRLERAVSERARTTSGYSTLVKVYMS